ncbi:MAG: ArsR/SmtB family transcription factor [Halobacteriota archaeon]
MGDERDLVDSVEQCRVDAETRAADLTSVADSIDQTEVTAHTDVFGALSSETRYRILRYLAAIDDDLCVCELAPLLDVSESAVSHALSVLVSAGLVTRRKDGRWRYYDVSERAADLLDVIVEDSSVAVTI